MPVIHQYRLYGFGDIGTLVSCNIIKFSTVVCSDDAEELVFFTTNNFPVQEVAITLQGNVSETVF
jgi:hypothetical protein